MKSFFTQSKIPETMPRLHFPGPSTLMDDPRLPKAKEIPRLLKIKAKPGKIWIRLYQVTPAIPSALWHLPGQESPEFIF